MTETCKRGHALTEGNIYRPPKAPTKASCRACIKLRDSARAWSAPKPCVDCGTLVELPGDGTRPSPRCDTCRVDRVRVRGAEDMRGYRAAGYRPVRGEREWNDEQRARFWSRVSRGDGCWEWQALRDRNGYGLFYVANWRMGAHRASWEMANGPIPDGLLVRHDCDNPPCVRPDHLRLGTILDNARDAMERRRYQYGANHWRNRYAQDAAQARVAAADAMDRVTLKIAEKR